MAYQLMQAFRILSLMLIVLGALETSHAQGSRRDGNWWRTQSNATKANYVMGFFDGMHLGKKFSYWGPLSDKGTKECAAEALNSFSEFEKYFKDVTNYQVVDGLDDFYTDYRNRRIVMHDAIWLVVNGIAGTPQEKLDNMVENWRKNSD